MQLRLLSATAMAGLALAACATQTPPAVASLTGPEWRLEGLLGAPVQGQSPVTLSFLSEGRAGGAGGCNRYSGSWEQKGEKLTLGKMSSTLMACPQPLMEQEGTYLRALETAKSYSFAPNGALVIETAQGPLKFRRN